MIDQGNYEIVLEADGIIMLGLLCLLVLDEKRKTIALFVVNEPQLFRHPILLVVIQNIPDKNHLLATE